MTLSQEHHRDRHAPGVGLGINRRLVFLKPGDVMTLSIQNLGGAKSSASSRTRAERCCPRMEPVVADQRTACYAPSRRDGGVI